MSESGGTIKGIVEYVKQNDANHFGIKLGGEWYNGKGKAPELAKGEEISIRYFVQKNKKEISEIINLATNQVVYQTSIAAKNNQSLETMQKTQSETKTQTINLQGKKITIQIIVE